MDLWCNFGTHTYSLALDATRTNLTMITQVAATRRDCLLITNKFPSPHNISFVCKHFQ